MVAPVALSQHDHARVWRDFAQKSAKHVEQFERSLEAPAVVQAKRFDEAIAGGRKTTFGREHGFAAIRSIDSYRNRVPISRWSDYAPWVERAQQSRDPILTSELPLHFECTSGSTAAKKIIPYTRALLQQFQRALIVWLAKLYEQCPEAAGPAWWSLSPDHSQPTNAANGVPIGSASDAAYLQGCIAESLFSTVIDTRASLGSMDWKTELLARVAASEDLALISVWSPTYLTALLDPVLSADSSADVLRRMRELLAPCRYDALRAAINAQDFSIVWPQLRVLSAWADGPSALYAGTVAKWFSGAKLIPKGLFATEAIVSFSWGVSAERPVAIESHFFEFLDEHGKVLLIDELAAGKRYEPVITTGGGLYRYALGDLIEVTGYLGRTPAVTFVGRSDARMDLVGEKLDESLVASAFVEAGIEGPAVLIPFAAAARPHYVLVAERNSDADDDALALRLDSALRDCHHYAVARHNGQLDCVDVHRVPSLASLLHDAWESLGKRSGDTKPARLVTSQALAHEMLSRCAASRPGA
jgi:hypothetical protein